MLCRNFWFISIECTDPCQKPPQHRLTYFIPHNPWNIIMQTLYVEKIFKLEIGNITMRFAINSVHKMTFSIRVWESTILQLPSSELRLGLWHKFLYHIEIYVFSGMSGLVCICPKYICLNYKLDLVELWSNLCSCFRQASLPGLVNGGRRSVKEARKQSKQNAEW